MSSPPPPGSRRRHSRGVWSCRRCTHDLELRIDEAERSAERLASKLNQQLTALMTGLEHQRRKLAEGPHVEELLHGVLQAAMEASALHQQIKGLLQRSGHEAVHPLDFSSLVRETLRLLEAGLPDRVKLQCHVASGLWVKGTGDLLKRALRNVVQNGAEAMEETGGCLAIDLGEREPSHEFCASHKLPPGRYAVLTVQDQGPGFQSDTLPRIFEPFFTTHPGRHRGVGLSQARTILQDHHGALTAANLPEQGAQLRLWLPCSAPEYAVKGADATGLYGSEHILYVDADPLGRDIAQWGLEALGYHVTAFGDGAAALDEFKQHQDFYDAVVFDLVLPRLGGIDLAHRIRHQRKGIPLILMTDLPVNPQTLLGAHTELSETLLKPYTVPQLAAALRRHLVPPGPSPAPKSATLRDGQRGHLTVLLAEDSAVTRGMIRSWLVQSDVRVVEAKDGAIAWEAFGQAESPFDLLLTDVVMPRMDGLELSRRVRAVDANIPIVVMTTVEDRETMKSALLAGVNDFLSKPFNKDILLECVQKLLADTSRRASARRSVETAHAVRMAQRALLAVPEKDLPLYTLYEPLTDAGGDVFRATRLADGRIFFVLGDVAGHSVISSYSVAAFLGMLSTFTDTSQDLSTLAHRLNMGIQDGPFSEVPVCTLLGLWNPGTGRVQLLNAGIPHGVLYRASTSTVQSLPLNGTPLGILSDPPMDETVLCLHPGDRLLFGTDGFFEVPSADRRPFEPQALEQWALLKDTPIQWALSLICEAARAHGEGVLEDDLLVLAFEQGPCSTPPGEFFQDMPSRASEIDHLIHEFKSFLESSETGSTYSADRHFEIVLVLREALTNAVFHGNQDRPDARVTFHAQFAADRARLLVRITDDGAGYPLEQHKTRMDPTADRGRGIPLMRHFAQAVSMVGSELCLTFNPEGPDYDAQLSPPYP